MIFCILNGSTVDFQNLNLAKYTLSNYLLKNADTPDRTRIDALDRVRADASIPMQADASPRPRGRQPVSARTPTRVSADASPRPRDSRTPGACELESAPTRGRQLASARSLGQARPRLYNPRPRVHFLLFLFCLLVGDLGFAYATPFPTCKSEGVTSNLRGILLHFCLAKVQGLYLSSNCLCIQLCRLFW